MSEIRTATISDLAGTGPATLTGQYAAKAWVNFDGTGTVAILESQNIASLTDNGTGVYTIAFTNSMTSADYAVSGLGSNFGGDGRILSQNDDASKTASGVRLQSADGAGGPADADGLGALTLGDLA